MEAYKIWATLGIKGDAQKQMTKFLETTQKVSVEVGKLTKLLNFSQSLSGIDSASRKVKNLGNEIETVTRKASNASHAIKRMGGGFIGGMTGMHLGAAGAGMAVAGTVQSAFHTGMTYERGMSQLKAMGYSPEQLSQVRKLTGTGLPGISPTSQLSAYISSQMATQSPAMAARLSPKVASTVAVLKNLYGDVSEHEVDSLIRAAEIRSGGNEAGMAKQLKTLLNMTLLSGGTIQPSKQLTYLRNAAGFGSTLSDLGYLSLEPVFQELGERAATGLTTLQGFLIGGIGMTKNRATSLQKSGLFGPVQYDASGRPVGSKFGAFNQKYADLLQEDPYALFKNVILPAYAKRGITGASDINKQLIYDFPRTSARDFQTMYKAMEKTDRLRENIPRLNAPNNLDFTTPGGALQRTTEAWTSFSKALGELTNPAYIDTLNLIAGGLENLAGALSKLSAIRGQMPTGEFGAGSGVSLSDIFSRASNSGTALSIGNYPSSSGGGKTQTAMVNVQLGEATLSRKLEKMIYSGMTPQESHGTNAHNMALVATSTNLPTPGYGSFG